MVTLLSTAGVQTPRLTMVPLGERRLLVRAVPLGAPRQEEKKGEGLKNQREEVTRQAGIVAPCLLRCTVLKNTYPSANTSNKALMEASKISTAKPHSEKKYLVFSYIVVQTTLSHNQV